MITRNFILFVHDNDNKISNSQKCHAEMGRGVKNRTDPKNGHIDRFAFDRSALDVAHINLCHSFRTLVRKQLPIRPPPKSDQRVDAIKAKYQLFDKLI